MRFSDRMRCLTTTTTTTTAMLLWWLLVVSSSPRTTTALQTATTSKSTTAREYNDLVRWLKSSFSDSFVSESLYISPSSRGGQGLFASENVPKDSLLFAVPRDACVTSSNVSDDEEVGEIFRKLMDKAGPGSYTVCLAGYIAKEYLAFLEGRETRYGPYLATLPWERGWNDQDHVLFWDENEIEQYLMGTLCYEDSMGLRDEVKLARGILSSIVGPSVLKARGEEEKPLVPFLPWTKPPPPKKITGLDEAVTGAFVVLLTRSFNDDFGAATAEKSDGDDDDDDEEEEETEMLIPMLDMLNHDANPSVTYSTNTVDGSIEVRARHNLIAGEEIFNSYREEDMEKMPKHRFFSRFGFVPGATEDVKTLMEDKSSVFYAKRQEI